MTAATAAPPAPAPQLRPVVWSAEDPASAQRAAAAQGFRVEITSARSEDSTSYANPDGTFTTEVSAGPVRVRDADAPTGWAPLDLNLRRAEDGTVGAVSHPDHLRLAGPRTAATAKSRQAKAADPTSVAAPTGLASLDAGPGRRLGLGWSGPLPTPVLSGPEATYRDVRPGIDLVLRATATGFEQFLVLRRRPAADTPFAISLPLVGEGLTATKEADGSVVLRDGQEAVRGRIPAPTAWDGSVDPRAGQSTRTSPVGMALRASGAGRYSLELTPDARWLADPATVYPVTIDPATTIKPYSDTWVETDYSSSQVGSTELRLGTYDSGKSVARSFISFNTAGFAGKVVSSATLSLYQFHSWSCSARSWQVWETGSFSSTTTWTNQPSWTKQWASASTAHGYNSSCAAATDNVTVTGLASSWAALPAAVRTVGLRAASETDNFAWKKFNSANAATHQPTLSVTYNSYPNTPGTPSHTPGTASATTTTGWTTTTTPTLRAVISDPDGGTVKALFDVYTGSTKVVDHLAGTSVTSGGTSTAAVPAGKLTNGIQYVVRAWGSDGSLVSPAWSTGYDRFTVDTTPPAAPVVSSATFPENAWTGAAGLGADGKAHWSAHPTSADASILRWVLDGTTFTSSAAVTGTASTVDIALAAPSTGAHTLKVQTVDAAGNVGATTSYSFYYGNGPLSQGLASLSADPVEPFGATSAVDPVMSDQPTLTAYVGPGVGSAVDYDFEVWDGALTTRVANSTVTAVPDGSTASWTIAPGTLDVGRDYAYRARGRTSADTGPWSAWRRLVDDRPRVPTDLAATQTDTPRPVLSVVANRPSNRTVTVRFQLWDAAGQPLGGSPLAEVEAVPGVRTSVAVPSDLVHPGDTIRWAATTCVGQVCSAQSAPQEFTSVTVVAPQTTKQDVTASDWGSSLVDGQDCDAGTCPLQSDDVTAADGDQPSMAFVRFTGLTSLPAGAQVTSAHLRLAPAGCDPACDSTMLNVFPIMASWPEPAAGELLFAAASTDDGVVMPAAGTDLDVTDLVTQWLDDPTINGGLALAVEPGTGATAHLGAAPTLAVEYLPPAAPSAPRDVTARAGDRGVLVNWEPGEYAGTDPDGTTYTVTVTNQDTSAATVTSATAGPVIVHGLTNGQAYTVTVTASTAGTTSGTSTPRTFTPVEPTDGAQRYLNAVTQYHTVTDAAPAASGDPATALTGLSERAMIGAVTLARSSSDWQAADVLRRHALPVDGEAWSASDTLVSADADGVVVRAVGNAVSTADASSESAMAEDFRFTAGTLSAVVDAADADLVPSLDDGTVTDLDEAPLAPLALAAADDPAPVQLDEDGLPVTGVDEPTGGFTTFTNSNGVNHAGVSNYAVDHAYDKPPRAFRDNDCTDFASKAMHTGGGLPFRNGWYRDDRHWWSNIYNRTYSWGAVVNLSRHLGYRNVTWVRYYNQAVPGDILFWKYREWKNIGHTSVITYVNGNDLRYSQHSDGHRNRKLSDALAALNAQGHGPVTLYIAHLGNR
ncbi:DNRLRE domain-containing protein [Micromonospora soli]|uniref:DNRLRE domain-containing protein n=1 Tax=Micromonospora sp. NBRC 110009 TaxID=3061627 RepID=UPI002673B1F1|nr:DNRLRE domain-containing protein [Micromonospora sp. NBRC 110009]WKT99302.1 DNRLRE domain-containing protein [Micromonospora sp. NBRC 110009]